MLQVYISHAPADKKHLDRCLRWLDPLRQKYFLRIWHDRPVPLPKPLPAPWPFLLGKPKPFAGPHHPDLEAQVAKADIYIFLTTHFSLFVPHIKYKEVFEAVGRYATLGEGSIQILPVPVTTSLWKEFSPLAGFAPFPDIFDEKKTAIAELEEVDYETDLIHMPPGGWPARSEAEHETEWKALALALAPIVEAMRRERLEEAHRQGTPTDGFFRHEPPPPPPEPTFREWFCTPLTGWPIVFLLFYLSYQGLYWVLSVIYGLTGGPIAGLG